MPLAQTSGDVLFVGTNVTLLSKDMNKTIVVDAATNINLTLPTIATLISSFGINNTFVFNIFNCTSNNVTLITSNNINITKCEFSSSKYVRKFIGYLKSIKVGTVTTQSCIILNHPDILNKENNIFKYSFFNLMYIPFEIAQIDSLNKNLNAENIFQRLCVNIENTIENIIKLPSMSSIKSYITNNSFDGIQNSLLIIQNRSTYNSLKLSFDDSDNPFEYDHSYAYKYNSSLAKKLYIDTPPLVDPSFIEMLIPTYYFVILQLNFNWVTEKIKILFVDGAPTPY